jgi:hypothetical protein
MRRVALLAVIGVLGVVGDVAFADLPAISRSTFRMLAREPNGWTFTVQAVPRQVSKIEIAGRAYTLFAGEPQERDAAPGMPYLPAEPLSLGIPFGVDITAELQSPIYEDVTGVLVAPTPSYRMSEEHEAVAQYALDARAYARDAFVPGATIFVDPPFVLRQQRICTIHLATYQYNPAQKILRRLVSGTLRVRYTQNTPIPQAHPVAGQESDPQFEEIYRSLIANYGEARLWRANTRAATLAPVDTTGSWFEAGRRYARIPVAIDGWYALSRQQLQSAGLSMSAFGKNDVRLFLGGVNVPFLWRPDTSIEFYGTQRRGDSTAYDFYSDTSMYWLTFQGHGTGLAITPAAQAEGAPSTSIASARSVRHFEQNTDYYEGTGESEITQNGPVTGEGWVWSYFYPNTTTSFPFMLDHRFIVAGDSAIITVKLFSTTLHYNTPDHIARFWVNDSLAGEVQFNGRNRGFFRAAVPAAWLKDGTNSLKITSVPTPSLVNQFYLDWFEVEYTRVLYATDGSLVFAGNPGSGVAAYTVDGFPDSLIEVYDLATLRKVSGGAVTGPGANGFAVVFKDSLGSQHRYVVASEAGRRPVQGIRGKEFADLRRRPGGADYMIVTHRLFLTAAQLLAAHRASHNGVRTLVVDVDDLYDEFGFGFKSAEAIKTFLAFAYGHWTAPALSSVLFFGDASWDPQKFMSSSVKTDFVPAYGVPAGDNWYGCFDPVYPFLSSLILGRLPVEDTVQARRTVDKVIGFDTPVLAEWNKNFMFITGGIGTSEQTSFNALTEPLIANDVLAPPIGGTPFRVYKNTDDVINGDKKIEMRALFKNGLGFVNFLGHAAGRLWNVDIGDPNELENTDGMLPFIASTSCNVSAFAEPSSNVLSEDFVLADNRAAIAMWGSSSLGYANSGTSLVNKMLAAVAKDSVRRFGAATTIARYQLWQESGPGYITVGMLNLNPLLGDPLNEMPIPLKPDIAVNQDDLTLNTDAPSPLDTALTFRTVVHEYGLLPGDSVSVSLADQYKGSTRMIVDGLRFHAAGHRDTLRFSWPAAKEPGQHHLTLVLDPGGVISEVTKANNSVVRDQYVYADVVLPVHPLESMVVPPGPQHLRITSPFGSEQTALSYTFELDTLPTFASGFKITSDAIAPGPVSGEWVTPALAEGIVYYWRARTLASGVYGSWVTGCFRTRTGAHPSGTVQLSVSVPAQFSRGVLQQLTAGDSGLTLSRNRPIHLYARSLGPRTDWLVDKYSIINVNEQTVRGFWWVIGNSFLLVRVNDFTGDIAVRGFDMYTQAAQADSMRYYIRNTPAGNYLAIIVIFDGKTNVTDSLYTAIESLGSTRIRSVLPNQSWALIARKGHPAETLESLTNDSAVVALDVPNVYSVGSGSFRSPVIPMPIHMDSLIWRSATIPGKTDAKVRLLARTAAGSMDTLRTIPAESTQVSLAGMDRLLSDTNYTGFALGASLNTSDPAYTPTLHSISLTVVPPPDLAISPQTIGPPQSAPPGGGDMGLPITVHNIGYRPADGARVVLRSINQGPGPSPVLASGTIGVLPVDSTREILLGFSTSGLAGLRTLEVQVSPSSGGRDLIAENNVARITLNFTSVKEPLRATMQVYADGVQLMDGDYVGSKPNLAVRLADVSGVSSGGERVALFVDRTIVPPSLASSAGGSNAVARVLDDGVQYLPELRDGIHELVTRLYRWNGAAGTDSIERRLTVSVQSDVRILRVFNYPNPFRRETEFTFVLTGNSAPDEVHVRIFTIAGRKIREIVVPHHSLQVGFNRVMWDGRDEEGDEIANGYYLYQVQVRGDGVERSAIEKLVKLK